MRAKLKNYGDKRDYPKIDIYKRLPNGIFNYAASTNWARTCQEAKEKYSICYAVDTGDLKAFFAK